MSRACLDRLDRPIADGREETQWVDSRNFIPSTRAGNVAGTDYVFFDHGLESVAEPAPRATDFDHDSESRQLPKNKYLNTLVLAARRLFNKVSGRACVCSFELEPKEK